MNGTTIIKVILTLFYAQQTLIFYWCLMSEKITGIIYTGNLSTLIFICSFFGNMTLGPFKGYIDSKINSDNSRKIIAGIIPQVIFGILVFSIYFESSFFTILSIILWHLVGMPFISASDSISDEATTYLLKSSSSFAVVQYIGTKIIGRIIFAYINDYYYKYKTFITIVSLLSSVFGIIIHSLFTLFHETKPEQSNNKSRNNNEIKDISFLLYPPLFMIVFEAIFLDIPLSSLKFIIPRFKLSNEVFMSASFIANMEIITSSIFMLIISNFKIFDRLTFKESWKKYSYLNLLSTIFRVSLTIALVYLTNIQTVTTNDNYFVATVTRKSITNSSITNYGMLTNVTSSKIRFLILLSITANASIDAFSSVMVIVLLKSYAKEQKLTYSTLDGWIRLFTYLPIIIPFIKRNPYLSFYTSEGYLVNTMVTALVLYSSIWYWNNQRINSHR